MIIKSLSRKSASFAQLYDYISEKEWSDFAVWHNIGGYRPDR